MFHSFQFGYKRAKGGQCVTNVKQIQNGFIDRMSTLGLRIMSLEHNSRVWFITNWWIMHKNRFFMT